MVIVQFFRLIIKPNGIKRAFVYFLWSLLLPRGGFTGGRYQTSDNSESEELKNTDIDIDNARKKEWEIYPNPITNKMTIKSKIAQKGDLLYIYTMMGKLLGKVELDKNSSASIKKLLESTISFLKSGF